ncbi:MAG: HNH endonuclease [Bacteroides sp.]|nr:HNH endonuclease [Bacteroides sp.]
MAVPKIDYKIYPSLLIAYQNLLDYEQIAEEPWNQALTPDEVYLNLECELIDAVNRAKGPTGEAAAIGTAFNEVVDCLIENRGSNNPEIKIMSVPGPTVEETVIRAEYAGYNFTFDVELCRNTARVFKGSLPQYLVSATMETAYGTVEFYGYIDEWVGNLMYDIKTTGNYKWPKFEKGWQRHVYPWCAIESGLTTEIESFTYYIIEWSKAKTGPLRAKAIFQETYSYDHRQSTDKLLAHTESFICWLEARRKMGLIQDKKIFGGTNPDGWSGVAVDRQRVKDLLFNTENKTEN